jgi:hypothetical protein
VASCASGAALTSRRFPPPWSAEVQPNHYVVRDANRQQLAYVYYENAGDQRPSYSRDEARRIAAREHATHAALRSTSQH